MQFQGVQTAVDKAGSTPDALATPDPGRRDSRNQAEAGTAEPGDPWVQLGCGSSRGLIS